MRRCLCAVLLSCFLALGTTGSLTAGDLTTAQAQQLVSAGQSAQPNGKAAEATLSIDGKNVVFTVTRDALGNVTATPVPGPDSAGITIGLVKIQFKVDSKGLLTPTSLMVVTSSQTITSYSLKLNEDGTIANLHQPGTGGVGGEPSKPKPVVGGIGGASGSLKDEEDDLPKDRYPGFTSGQLGLPAGTKPGEAPGEASPSVP